MSPGTSVEAIQVVSTAIASPLPKRRRVNRMTGWPTSTWSRSAIVVSAETCSNSTTRLPATRPRAAMSWVKLVRPRTRANGRGTTYVPDPWRRSTRPSATSASIAARTVIRATPQRRLSSRSLGRRSPTWAPATSSRSRARSVCRVVSSVRITAGVYEVAARAGNGSWTTLIREVVSRGIPITPSSPHECASRLDHFGSAAGRRTWTTSASPARAGIISPWPTSAARRSRTCPVSTGSA